MKNPFAHIKKHVQQVLESTIDQPQQKYFVLGISGGPDSVLLAHIFHALNLRFCLAHVNYGLRGKSSEGDELFVKKLAKQLQVDCFTEKANQQELEKKGASIQMMARDIRYRFFEKVCKKEKARYLVLAHQADDQVETVLLNFFRGCGIDGLTGMKTLEGKKLRPLLDIRKEEILSALKEKKLAFRTDQSNLKDEYKRNFLRNTIIPQIEKKWPGIQGTILENISRFRSVAGALENISFPVFNFQENVTLHLESLQEPLQREAFRKQAVEAGFRLGELEKLLQNKSQETKKLSGTAGTLEKKSGQLRFIPTLIETKKAGIRTKGNRVSLTVPDTSFLKSMQEEIDAGAIKGQLKLRPWQAGDKMIPLGMKGFKKVSDLLTDLKLPASLKSKVYVLCDGEKIVWLVGFRIDERVKLKERENKSGHIFLSIN